MERFLGFFGLEPNEKVTQYRDILNSGGKLEDVLNLAEQRERERIDSNYEKAPMVGGVIGGMVGGIPGAAIGGAAGEAARQLNRHADGRGPSSMGEAAKSIAIRGALEGGATAVGGVVSKGIAKAAPRLMQSALKPTQSVLDEYGTTAPRLVKTLLDEGVNVTQGGLAKLQALLKATNSEIRKAVNAASGDIDKSLVSARALETAAKMSKQVNPTADLKAVSDVVEEFTNHPVFKGPKLSIAEAQDMKVGTYQQIGKKYGEVSSAGIETQKALARGLKEEIAHRVPEIAKLNLTDSQLMAAMESVGRRVALAGNRDPIGFAWVTANPVPFLAALMDRSPIVKSMLAHGFYKDAARAGKVSEQAIRLAVQVLVEGGGESDRAPDQE